MDFGSAEGSGCVKAHDTASLLADRGEGDAGGSGGTLEKMKLKIWRLGAGTRDLFSSKLVLGVPMWCVAACVYRQGDHVFIGNQTEQLQKEPAHVVCGCMRVYTVVKV